MKHKIPWKNGHLVLDYTSDYLKVVAANISFEIRPRSVIVYGYKSYREAENKKKYIYIYFIEELKPFTGVEKQVLKTIMDYYEIRYVKTYYDEYYTIILPGTFLADYITFTSEELLLVFSSKRKTFYEELENMLTIYVV